MNPSDNPIYDIAVSFAGERREYVEATVRAADALGLRVFYDKNMTNDWWGKNFIVEQRKVYSSQARFFVPFISTEYLAKPIPRDEFSAAMMRAVNDGDGYVLPVLMGDVEVPSELLHPHIGYLRAKDYTPEQLAEQLSLKVGRAQSSDQQPRNVGAVVGQALKVPLPKVQSKSFSKYRELRTIFEYLAERLDDAGRQLETTDFICTVRKTDERIVLRIEHDARTVYSLDIAVGSQGMGDDAKLTFGPGGSGMTAWVTPIYDVDAQQPALDVFDLSLLGSIGGAGGIMSKEAFFDKLWERIVETLERQH